VQVLKSAATCRDEPCDLISGYVFRDLTFSLTYTHLVIRMTARPVNAALLGSGLFATGAYLPSLKEVAGLNVSTVWSRSEESARKLEGKAAELGLKAPAVKFGDDGLRSVLGDKSIEAVILVLPITVQPDMIRRAWRAGKHVLSEKPLGRDVAEGKALIREYENEWKPNGLIWRVAESKYC
jgi:saccharopine dehydrogenase-like NADP-dependent oxidoreductase